MQPVVSCVGNAIGTSGAGVEVTGLPVSTAGFGEVTCVLATAVLGDADVVITPVIEESDTLVDADFSAVSDDDLVGLEGSLNFADDLSTRKIGYVGKKKYIRINCTPTGTADANPTTFMGLVILGSPRLAPVAQEHANTLTAS